MEKELKIINEDNLFKNIRHFFGEPRVALKEAIQNARRAGADKVDIYFDDTHKIVTIQNNGSLIKDFSKLIILSDSGWDSEMMENETPAGWGIMSMISVCKELWIRNVGESGEFEELVIDSHKFMNNSDYRNGLLKECAEKVSFVEVGAVKINMVLEEKTYTKLRECVFEPTFMERGESSIKGYWKYFIEIELSFHLNFQLVESIKNRSDLLKDENKIAENVWVLKRDRRDFLKGMIMVFNGELLGSNFGNVTVYAKDNKIIRPVLPFRDSCTVDDVGYEVMKKSINEAAMKECLEDLKNEFISGYDLNSILSKVLKNRDYLNGADLKFLKKFPFKNSKLSSKDKGYDIYFDETVLKNGVEFEAEMVINLNNVKEYSKTKEENFFPDWVNEKIRLINKYHEGKKKIIHSDIPADKMEVVDYFAGQDEQFLVFVDKNFMNFNKKIYVLGNSETGGIFVYCNKEDYKVLTELPYISNYFHSFIYYSECDSYETQERDFEDRFELHMEQIFPRVRSISDILKEECIPENEIKSIKNNKEDILIELNRKVNGKKFIKVKKTKKSIIDWRF